MLELTTTELIFIEWLTSVKIIELEGRVSKLNSNESKFENSMKLLLQAQILLEKIQIELKNR